MTVLGARTYYRISEVARLMEVDHSTVWRWCKEGSIPCTRVGCWYRIDKAEFEQWRAEAKAQSGATTQR